ncbi:MAG: oligosaccharide flippase family protein [Rhodospirillaceae bacterium]
MTGDAPIGVHIARGAAWMVSMRWLMRAIGLINTVVLARILSPDDFGIMAMSAVIVELLMMLSDTNVDVALIRDPKQSREIYDSAWTIQALFGLAVAVAVVAITPALVAYYDDPRVAVVMYILALRPAILGLENVGVVEFRKNLDFAKEFRYWIFRRLSLFVFGLVLALTLRNYLALAIAAPISALVAVVFSFTMSRYRPRLCFSHIGLVWGASRWMILQNTAQVALERADEFVIGGVATPTAVGNYYIAGQVAPMPTRELAWPVERALMPTYAKITGDAAELRRTVVAVMGVMAVVCFSTGVGIMSVAQDFVVTVFGRQWLPAIPFFEWLAIFGIFAGLGRPLMPLFYAMHYERKYAVLSAAQVAVTLPLLFYAAHRLDLVAVAAIRTGVAVGFFMLFAWGATRISTVTPADFLRVLWRPAAAALVMAIIVKALHDDTITWPILSLGRDCVIGGAAFVTALLGLWIASGRPEGAEYLILRSARKLFRRHARDVAGNTLKQS